MGLLFPFLHAGFLEAIAIRKPEGLPVAVPLGHRDYAGTERHCRYADDKQREQNRRMTRQCAHKLSLNNASAYRKYVESTPTQTCRACEMCNPAEKKQTNKNIAQPSRCKKQYMSWTWFQLSEADRGRVHESTKHPSSVPRISARAVGTHYKTKSTNGEIEPPARSQQDSNDDESEQYFYRKLLSEVR